MKFHGSAKTTFWLGIAIWVLATSASPQGKNPVILIPGLSGSELRHKDTNERIWFRALKPRSEDLRLPVIANFRESRDDLVRGDILREVKVGAFSVTDVYAGFIKAMRARGGYFEEKWHEPTENGAEDSLYVFPYDWRLDNVDNARLLVREVKALKRRLGKPDLKFDIVAHSMGGLISRYAVMYGDAELPDGKPVPNWEGARLFDRIVLMGTPNEGSVSALSSLINGFTIGGLRIDLPFLQDTSKFTIFTIPAAYQLLPAPGTFVAYDEKLRPVTIDIYDPKVWSEYGWNPIEDPDFSIEFRDLKQDIARKFFESNLARAKRFYEALDAAKGETGGVELNVLGADCRDSTDAVVLYRDGKSQKWKTIFEPRDFISSDGVKVSGVEVKRAIAAPGDGVVSYRSLTSATISKRSGIRSSLGIASERMICGDHNRLAASAKVQEYIIGLLAKPAKSGSTEEN
jgi:pimeloyl-ACP methyl ester carboxylesterase